MDSDINRWKDDIANRYSDLKSVECVDELAENLLNWASEHPMSKNPVVPPIPHLPEPNLYFFGRQPKEESLFDKIKSWAGYNKDKDRIVSLLSVIPECNQVEITGNETVGELCQIIWGLNVAQIMESAKSNAFGSIFGKTLKNQLPQMGAQMAKETFGLLWDIIYKQSVNCIAPAVCTYLFKTSFANMNFTPSQSEAIECLVRQCIALGPQMATSGGEAADVLQPIVDCSLKLCNEMSNGGLLSRSLPLLKEFGTRNSNLICQIFQCISGIMKGYFAGETVNKRELALQLIKQLTKMTMNCT